MRALYRSFRDIGASHWEAIACVILTPLVIAGAFALFTMGFFGLGGVAAFLKGL